MPMHAERRVLPYQPELLSKPAAEVDRYPAFLTWCVAVRTRKCERRRNFISQERNSTSHRPQCIASEATIPSPISSSIKTLRS